METLLPLTVICIIIVAIVLTFFGKKDAPAPVTQLMSSEVKAIFARHKSQMKQTPTTVKEMEKKIEQLKAFLEEVEGQKKAAPYITAAKKGIERLTEELVKKAK